MSRDQDEVITRLDRKRWFGPIRPASPARFPKDDPLNRIRRALARARLGIWIFSVSRSHGEIALRVFYPDPSAPGGLASSDRYPIPEDSATEEARDVVRRAVAELAGPDALAELSFPEVR